MSRAVHRTSKLTVAPARTFCPPGGVWMTIMLDGDGWAGALKGDGVMDKAGAMPGAAVAGSAGAMLTFPSLNPASWSVRLTLPNGCPTKLGIT